MTVVSRRRPRHHRGSYRSRKVQVRLTEAEWEIVDRAAREQGLATAALVREAALGFVVGERLRDGTSALDRLLPS